MSRPRFTRFDPTKPDNAAADDSTTPAVTHPGHPVYRRSAFALMVVLLAGGCANQSDPVDFRPAAAVRRASTQATATTEPSNLQTLAQFRVAVTPPAGWTLKTTSADDRHEHVTWVSPSGHTAFGIVFFRLPWPVGHELAFRYGFLAEMRSHEKSADVLEKYWDPQIEGLRFVVNSPNYQVSAKFLVRGTRGFAPYTGTRRDAPIDPAELEQATAAREMAEFAGEVSASPVKADDRR